MEGSGSRTRLHAQIHHHCIPALLPGEMGARGVAPEALPEIKGGYDGCERHLLPQKDGQHFLNGGQCRSVRHLLGGFCIMQW